MIFDDIDTDTIEKWQLSLIARNREVSSQYSQALNGVMVQRISSCISNWISDDLHADLRAVLCRMLEEKTKPWKHLDLYALSFG
jgi:hypothetical protein